MYIIKEENPEWFDEEFYKLINSACKKAYIAECGILDWIFEKGELDFKGELFRIMPEYQILPNEKKVDMLIMLINWANDEIKKANS